MAGVRYRLSGLVSKPTRFPVVRARDRSGLLFASRSPGNRYASIGSSWVADLLPVQETCLKAYVDQFGSVVQSSLDFS